MSSVETIARQWDLLEMIPRLPWRISATELHQRITTTHDVSLRTVQRDLTALETRFPITCEQEGRTQHWHWLENAQQFEIPRMNGSMAATMLLARDYLKPVLPAAVLSELNPYFDRASEVLDETPLKGWNKKVRIIDRGLTLIPPRVNNQVRDVVYQALLQGRQITAGYKARNRDQHKDYTLNPLGMVVKGGVFYLVVTFAGYTDIRQLALHRMNGAELLESKVESPKGYSLTGYIEDDQGFSYPLSPEKIRLELLFAPNIAFHLTEVKLSSDQTEEEMKDGRLRVKATVADSDELRWWLKAYGDDVEVKKPRRLAKQLAIKKGN